MNLPFIVPLSFALCSLNKEINFPHPASHQFQTLPVHGYSGGNSIQTGLKMTETPFCSFSHIAKKRRRFFCEQNLCTKHRKLRKKIQFCG
jgi:hypothetical protein